MSAAGQPQTLRDVCADLWRGKAFIFGGILTGGFLAALFIFTAIPHYKAQMILSPANAMNGAEVSSLLADEGLSALRYLVQRTGVTNSSDFMRFENTYAGPSVAAFLLKDSKIIEGLMRDSTFGFSADAREWTSGQLAEYTARRVRLDPVGSTSLRRMTYLHPDREFGSYFLYSLHRLTDELIRQKIRQEAMQRVRYLQQASEDTSNPDHRRALTALLMEQERLLMLVSIETAYAASVIEPPSVSTKPVWPDALLVFPVFISVGAVLGFVLFGFRDVIRAKTLQTASQPRRHRWFKINSRNNNERRLSVRDAAE